MKTKTEKSSFLKITIGQTRHSRPPSSLQPRYCYEKIFTAVIVPSSPFSFMVGLENDALLDKASVNLFTQHNTHTHTYTRSLSNSTITGSRKQFKKHNNTFASSISARTCRMKMVITVSAYLLSSKGRVAMTAKKRMESSGGGLPFPRRVLQSMRSR